MNYENRVLPLVQEFLEPKAGESAVEEVRSAIHRTFDYEHDGKFYELKANSQRWINLTDNQCLALHKGELAGVFHLCKRSGDLRYYDSTDLLSKYPRVESTYYWYLNGLPEGTYAGRIDI